MFPPELTAFYGCSLVVSHQLCSRRFLQTTCAQAIKNWEAKHEASAEMATEVVLCLQNPPIAKLDTKALGSLKKCQKLSLSTNVIDRMINLTGMAELRILSRGRNNLKKIEKLEDVATTRFRRWMDWLVLRT